MQDQVTTWWRLVAGRAAATPDAVMLRDDLGRSLTFAEYAERAERVAAALRDQGVGAGTVVSWQLPTCAEAMVLLAAMAAQATEIKYSCRMFDSSVISNGFSSAS